MELEVALFQQEQRLEQCELSLARFQADFNKDTISDAICLRINTDPKTFFPKVFSILDRLEASNE